MSDLWKTSTGRRVRQQAWARDKQNDAPCHICHLPIDYSLGTYRPGKSTEAWEPDHIRPRDKYPELVLELSNIAASHAHCNRAKKNKAGINELGKPTRNWFGS